MSENENIKYPKKSEKYRGVYQRKDGTWFYRIKKVLIKKIVVVQHLHSEMFHQDIGQIQ